MGFSKITALSLTDLFVQQIENMILSGELAVGDRLPPARELCVRMGVSRPVISAGLVELEKLGFVEIQPRQGVFISDYRRRGTVETLVAIMRFNSGTMRRTEVKSLLEVREYLECLCVRLVIEKATDGELEALSGIVEEIGLSPEPEQASEAAFRFYHELAILSGNVLLPLIYYSFRSPGIHLWTLYCRKNGPKALYELKLGLYRALLNRDEEDALERTHGIMKSAIKDINLYGT